MSESRQSQLPELEPLAPELLADPCELVRRACQLADYGPEAVVPDGPARRRPAANQRG